MHTTWPGAWFKIKERLEKLDDHYIDRETYETMCRKEKITGKKNRETLLGFLHDLGVALHFDDFELDDTHVLEPEWVTGAVYKIINSPALADSGGVLKLEMLDEILKKEKDEDYDYPRDRYRFITGLMEKFELCYPMGSSHNVLVPDLLAVQEPGVDFDYDNSLRFILEYDFLPRSVMPRFIVNMYRDIDDNLQWRTGVVLADGDFQSRAVVKADYQARRIYIYVVGEQKRDYFAALLLTLRRLHRSFEKIKVKELIPLPDDLETTVPYKQLLFFEKEGQKYYLSETEKKYRVKDLLGAVAVVSENKDVDPKILEEMVFKFLQKVVNEKDNKESVAKKLNDFISIQPSLFGVININIKGLIDRVLAWDKKRRGKKEAG